MNAIEVFDLCVSFGKKEILKDVNICVREGEFWGIIGPNGGGKTTFLRSILGILKPSSGSIKIFGRSPKEASRLGFIGYLPQKRESINLSLTPFEIVLLGTVSRKNLISPFSKEEVKRAEYFLDLLGMGEKMKLPFNLLSGGEKQRTFIARALVAKPKILLLDEPNTGVDVVAQEGFYQLLKRLKEELNLTILMVSHDVGVVSNFVDKVACLNRKLHFAGDPRRALDCRLLEELYGSPVEIYIHHPKCDGCHIYQSL